MACTFSLLVGSECGPDPRSKNKSCLVVPLVSCNKNIACHKELLKFSGCHTEIELILARSACFRTPVNIQEMTICPLHHDCLGIGWWRLIRQCSVPQELSGHNGTAKEKVERGCTLLQSQLNILEATEKFVLVGSGKQMFYVLNISSIYARVIQIWEQMQRLKTFYIGYWK